MTLQALESPQHTRTPELLAIFDLLHIPLLLHVASFEKMHLIELKFMFCFILTGILRKWAMKTQWFVLFCFLM